MLERTDKGTLICLDELARATCPKEGVAFSHALIEFLKEKRCFGIFSTHLYALLDADIDVSKFFDNEAGCASDGNSADGNEDDCSDVDADGNLAGFINDGSDSQSDSPEEHHNEEQLSTSGADVVHASLMTCRLCKVVLPDWIAVMIHDCTNSFDPSYVCPHTVCTPERCSSDDDPDEDYEGASGNAYESSSEAQTCNLHCFV